VINRAISRARILNRARGFVFAKPLWKQLEGRASHLSCSTRRLQSIPLGQRENAIPLTEITEKTRSWLENDQRQGRQLVPTVR